MPVALSTHPFNLREKLLAKGVKSLSDPELLAVFISSGNRQKSCLQLAYELLAHLGDLRSVVNSDLQHFKQVTGLGEVRYLQLQAVIEICRRSDFIQLQKEFQIKNSHQAYHFLKKRLRDYKNETFAALFLDSQNRLVAYEELFSGTINAVTVYIRPIIELVFKYNAAALILAHNHPSGLSMASPQDLTLTQHLQEALSLIDVKLLDHIVIGDNEVYSIIAENQLVDR